MNHTGIFKWLDMCFKATHSKKKKKKKKFSFSVRTWLKVNKGEKEK
jgi:hypothetical protein